MKCIVGVDAADGGDVGGKEAKDNRGSEKHGTLKRPLAEEADETANRGGENEQQSDTEEPRGEDADDEAPNSSGYYWV